MPKRPGTMARGEERRLPMADKRLMFAVRKLHGPTYRVTVYRMGESSASETVVVNAMDATCTCGSDEHCLHRAAVRHCDPGARRVWAVDVPTLSAQAPGTETT